MIPMEVESSSELEAEGMEGYDDEIDSALTSWYTLSADRDTAEHGLRRRRHSYSSSLSSSSSLTTTCRRPDGMIIKAQYGTQIMIFGLPLASSLVDLEEKVTERLLELRVGTFRIKYQDDEGDWILITDDDDLHFCMASLRSVEQNTILMLIEAVDRNTILLSDKAMQDWQRKWNLINPLSVLAEFLIVLGFVLDFWSFWNIEGRSITSPVYFLKSSAISTAFCSTLPFLS